MPSLREWRVSGLGGYLAGSHGGHGLKLEHNVEQKQLQKYTRTAKGAGICPTSSFSMDQQYVNRISSDLQVLAGFFLDKTIGLVDTTTR